MQLQPDGSAVLTANQENIELFQSFCEKYDILFLNTGQRFLDEYDEKRILPYGFRNTTIGGHLNRYGHAMMAEELYNLILEEEGTAQ